jgi:hypothetical protein
MDGMDGMVSSAASRDVISLTRHARRRSARRNVAPNAVEYVLAHGRMVRRTGVRFYFLGRRDIPACDRCASWATRLEGVIVVVAPDGGVITVYRNRHGLRPIIRKMKYRLFERNSRSDDDAAPADDSETPISLPARASA